MILSCWSSLASFTIPLMKVLPNSDPHWRVLKRLGSDRSDTNFGSEIFKRFSRRLAMIPWKVWPHKRNAVSTALAIGNPRNSSLSDIFSRKKRSGRAISRTLYCSALRDFSFASALDSSGPLMLGSLKRRAIELSSWGHFNSKEELMKL